MKNSNIREGRKGQRGRKSKYDISFMRKVAMEYLNGDLSLYQLEAQYNASRQSILRWSKQFSSELSVEKNETNILVTTQEQKEFGAIKKQNEELKKKLEYEQMKNFALETMVDLAKSELGIDLRKNSGAKQPKK
jgi:hypothetical protein